MDGFAFVTRVFTSQLCDDSWEGAFGVVAFSLFSR